MKTGDAMKKSSEKRTTRREILKKGSYVVPAVLTLAVQPSFATTASGSGGGGGGGGIYGQRPKGGNHRPKPPIGRR
jgi:hypothetical protein